MIGSTTTLGTPVGWWGPSGGTAVNALRMQRGAGSSPTWEENAAQSKGIAVPAFSYMALFTPYGTTQGTSVSSTFTLFIVFTIRSVAYPYPNLCRQQQTESDTNNYCDVYGDWGASRAFFTFRRMIPSSGVTQESQSVNQMNAGGTYILACAASNSEMEQALRFG